MTTTTRDKTTYRCPSWCQQPDGQPHDPPTVNHVLTRHLHDVLDVNTEQTGMEHLALCAPVEDIDAPARVLIFDRIELTLEQAALLGGFLLELAAKGTETRYLELRKETADGLAVP